MRADLCETLSVRACHILHTGDASWRMSWDTSFLGGHLASCAAGASGYGRRGLGVSGNVLLFHKACYLEGAVAGRLSDVLKHSVCTFIGNEVSSTLAGCPWCLHSSTLVTPKRKCCLPAFLVFLGGEATSYGRNRASMAQHCLFWIKSEFSPSHRYSERRQSPSLHSSPW